MAVFGTFVDGVSLKASELNTLGAASTYTPKLYQPAEIIAGISGASAFYFTMNDIVYGSLLFYCGASGTAGQRIEIDLPVTAASSSIRIIGTGYFWDDSAGLGGEMTLVHAVQYSTTRMALLTNTANSLTTYFGTTDGPNTAVANNDFFYLQFIYKAA